jgi:hypothetical protein
MTADDRYNGKERFLALARGQRFSGDEPDLEAYLAGAEPQEDKSGDTFTGMLDFRRRLGRGGI